MLSTAMNQMKDSAPWLAIAPDVCAIPMGPERLQVLIAPVIICDRPESDPVMIRQVCSTPLWSAVPTPGASVAGSKARPPATPMRHWVAKPPSS